MGKARIEKILNAGSDEEGESEEHDKKEEKD
jgi:hypothetical protein